MVSPGYYDGSYPPSVYAPPAPAATGATAGIPGTWTPAGSTPPASPANMSGIVATPATAWTAGQYVQTGTAGAAGRTTWTGSGWVGGAAPLSAAEVSGMTVAQVEQLVGEHPELLDEVAQLERDGKARPTLLSWLDTQKATAGQ